MQAFFILLAPRPGLEPGTNGLTVQVTLCFYWVNLKNLMGFSDTPYSNNPKPEPIPKSYLYV